MYPIWKCNVAVKLYIYKLNLLYTISSIIIWLQAAADETKICPQYLFYVLFIMFQKVLWRSKLFQASL